MSAAATIAEGLSALEQRAAVVPLDNLGLLRVAGVDHREALHRVVSQEIRGLALGEGRLALLLAPKGRFRALMAAFAAEEAVCLVAPPGRGEELRAGLATYLRFSRSRIEPIALAGAVAVLGPGWETVAAERVFEPARLAAGGWSPGRDGTSLWFGRTLLGLPGAIAAFATEASAHALGEQLARAGVVSVDPIAVELERVRVGWPAWGAELDGNVLPPEVGLEKLAVSYTKGCYVGQETIARLAAHGHPNRALVGVREGPAVLDAPALPTPLTVIGEERPRGVLTSWVRHPTLGGIGLALVRRELRAPGTVLAAGDSRFEVSPLPLW
jgi:folate-binding protein YgfZ